MGSRLAFLSPAKWPNTCHAPAGTRCTSLPMIKRSLTMSAGGTEVITLDCTGTIMRIKGSMPRLYLGVLEDHLGVQEGAIPGVDDKALLDSFRTSLKHRDQELPCFGAGVMSSEDWWAEVVLSAFRGAGVPEASLADVFDEVFAELYHNVFTREPAWELVPGAKDVIGGLKQWCQEDHGPQALGVVSNFDERLHPLLQNLGVYENFDFVLTSRECGSPKPEPQMFREALRRAGANVSNGLGLHIGDTFNKDVLGAQSVGWSSVLITRKTPSKNEREVEHVRVEQLTDVLPALGLDARR